MNGGVDRLVGRSEASRGTSELRPSHRRRCDGLRARYLRCDSAAARLGAITGLPPVVSHLAVGADRAVVREYEAVVEQTGMTAGRVVPLTLALAVGTADASFVPPIASAARAATSGWPAIASAAGARTNAPFRSRYIIVTIPVPIRSAFPTVAGDFASAATYTAALNPE